MIRNLVILCAIIAAGTAYTLYTDQRMPVPQELQANKAAPDFSFKTLKGKKYALADFKHKVVVLNFWASWCAPCVIEFPQMLALADKTKKDSIFIFLSLDENKDDIEKFLEKHGKAAAASNVLIAQDTDKSVSEKFGTYKLPESYIIAPNGMIAEKITGADILWDSSGMVEKISDFAQ